MKFQIAKSDLVAACQVVAEAVASSGNEIHTHFLFRMSPTDDSKIELVGNSVKTCALCPLQAATVLDKGDSFTIEASSLGKWLPAVRDVALTIEYTNKVVLLTAPGQGSVRFPSLDPAGFPPFDASLASAKHTATIKADRLKSILSTAKLFAGQATADTKNPDTCAVEVQKGIVVSTDKATSVCFITAPGLENTTLRIHVRDLGGLTKFLGYLGDGDVEILDHDKANYFRGVGGILFGTSRYQQGPPPLKPPTDTPHYQWKVSRAELREQVAFLIPAIPKEDPRMMLDRNGGPIILTTQSKTGTEKNTVDVTCLGAVDEPNAPSIPAGGIPVDYQRLLYLLDSMEGEDVTLGISISGPRKQYVRVSEKHEEDEYVLLLAARH